MPGVTTQINEFHKNKFEVRFSNVPNMTGYKDIDIHVLNNYLKGISIPDLSIPMLYSTTGQYRQLHPSPIGSRELQTVTIEFNIDEHAFNYWLLSSWLYHMRYGHTCGKKSLKGEELLRFDCIDAIEICFLDNDGRVLSKIRFKHCIINNLSTLDLKYGTSELGTMIATFEVEEQEFVVEQGDEGVELLTDIKG